MWMPLLMLRVRTASLLPKKPDDCQETEGAQGSGSQSTQQIQDEQIRLLHDPLRRRHTDNKLALSASCKHVLVQHVTTF